MEQTDSEQANIRELSRRQRRILGVLLEKGFTTPEYYPLTLKATTTGSNQKSNRDPVMELSEDDVEEALEELRERRLTGEVHTDGGRAARYRHYMRHRFKFTEPQLAILTELLLRGRQTLGELRSRASRMVKIDSLDDLRSALTGLIEMQMVQSSGRLQRRGVEVDHDLYQTREGQQMTQLGDDDDSDTDGDDEIPSSSPVRSASKAVVTAIDDELRQEVQELRAEVESLRDRITRNSEQLDEIRQSLGM